MTNPCDLFDKLSPGVFYSADDFARHSERVLALTKQWTAEQVVDSAVMCWDAQKERARGGKHVHSLE